MYEFEEENENQPQERLQRKWLKQNWPETLVQGIGVILLLVGLWASIQVLLEALRLYRDPVRIEQLAAAIERGSNLDKGLFQANSDAAAENYNTTGPTGQGRQATDDTIHLSYFVAWIIALLILMLIALIAFSSMRTGNELVLQDRRMKHLMQAWLKEPGKFGKQADK